MRVVIFTGHADFESSQWWPVIVKSPSVDSVLVCRQLPPSMSGAAGRFWRNVRKHGILWIPYRFAYEAISIARGFLPSGLEPVRPAARSLAVERIEVAKLAAPETVARVREWHPDLGVSIGAPILKPELFSIPSLGTLNVHEGKVPDFRGAPPAFWELTQGATEIGATVHWVEAGLDTGPIIAEARAPIYPFDRRDQLEARVDELALHVLDVALRRVLSGDAKGNPQADGGRTNRGPLLRARFTLARRLFWRRLRRAAHPMYVAKMLFIMLWMAVVRPLRDLVRTIRGRHPVRVFTFHRVTDLCRDGMTVPPSVFLRQMSWIQRHHEVVDIGRAVALLAGDTPLRRPVAAITFDDGYGSVLRAALPATKAVGVTATCFVCTDLVGTDARLAHDRESPVREWMDLMTWTELDELRAAGWTLGAHTATHPRLSQLTGDALKREVADPLARLKAHTGEPSVAMAYPFGQPADITPEGVAAVRASGYTALFSDFGGENFRGDDPFRLRRIEVGGNHDTLAWKASSLGLDLVKLRNRVRRTAKD